MDPGDTITQEEFNGSSVQSERIKYVLEKHDLTWVYQKIIPHLPASLSQKTCCLVWNRMGKLKDSSLNIEIPPGILDYDNGPRHQILQGGATSPPHTDYLEASNNPKVHRSALSIGGDITCIMDVMEHMLLMQAFLSYGTGTRVHKKVPVSLLFSRSYTKLVEKLVSSTSRGISSNGWRLPKLVDLFHLQTQMEEYGPPCCFDANTGERGLKVWSKRHAKSSKQQGQEVFEKSVGDRMNQWDNMKLATEAGPEIWKWFAKKPHCINCN